MSDSTSPYGETPCFACMEKRHGDCSENYCTCDCGAAERLEETTPTGFCCGQPVTDDGYCQFRPHHQRQLTAELLEKAVSAAARQPDLHSQVRAALEVVL